MRRLLGISLAAACAVAFGSAPARAETPADFLASFERSARTSDNTFDRFSGQRGEHFFNAKHGGEWSCASCHTSNPAASGKHTKTGKSITPLAPGANTERFTNPAKVAKWFKRNCNDVLNRECTAQEKGDVLAYLLSVRP